MARKHNIQKNVDIKSIDTKSIDDIIYEIILDTLQDKEQDYANKLHKLSAEREQLAEHEQLILKSNGQIAQARDTPPKMPNINTIALITTAENKIYSELASIIEYKLFDTVLKKYCINDEFTQNVDLQVNQYLNNIISSNYYKKSDEIKYFQNLQTTLLALKTNNTEYAIKQFNTQIQDLHAYIERNKKLLDDIHFDQKLGNIKNPSKDGDLFFYDDNIDQNAKTGFSSDVGERINIFSTTETKTQKKQDFNLNEYREALNTNIRNMTKLGQLLTIKMYIADFKTKTLYGTEILKNINSDRNIQSKFGSDAEAALNPNFSSSKSHFIQFIASICDVYNNAQHMAPKDEQLYKGIISIKTQEISEKIIHTEDEIKKLQKKLKNEEVELNKSMALARNYYKNNNFNFNMNSLNEAKQSLHAIGKIEKITQKLLYFIGFIDTTYETQTQQIDKILQNKLQINALEQKIQTQETELDLMQKKKSIINNNVIEDIIQLFDTDTKFALDEHRSKACAIIEMKKQEIQKMNILSRVANAILSFCRLTTSYEKEIKKLDQQLSNIKSAPDSAEIQSNTEIQSMNNDKLRLIEYHKEREKLKNPNPEMVKTKIMNYIKQCKINGVEILDTSYVNKKVKLDEILPMYNTLSLIKELSEDQKRNVDQNKQNANVQQNEQAEKEKREKKIKPYYSNIRKNAKNEKFHKLGKVQNSNNDRRQKLRQTDNDKSYNYKYAKNSSNGTMVR